MRRGLSTQNPIFADFWTFMPYLASKVVTRFGKEFTSLRTCSRGTVSQAAKTTSHTSSFDVIGITLSTSVPPIDQMFSTGLRSDEVPGLGVRMAMAVRYPRIVFDVWEVATSCSEHAVPLPERQNNKNGLLVDLRRSRGRGAAHVSCTPP